MPLILSPQRHKLNTRNTLNNRHALAERYTRQDILSPRRPPTACWNILTLAAATLKRVAYSQCRDALGFSSIPTRNIHPSTHKSHTYIESTYLHRSKNTEIIRITLYLSRVYPHAQSVLVIFIASIDRNRWEGWKHGMTSDAFMRLDDDGRAES